jgi:hypothetical protein
MDWLNNAISAIGDFFSGGGGEAAAAAAPEVATDASGAAIDAASAAGAGTQGALEFAKGAADTGGGGVLDKIIGVGGSALKTALPALLSHGTSALINKVFGSEGKAQPYQDIRNPAQTQTYQQLMQDYRQGQTQMPMWNSVMEDEIRRSTLGEAARANVADSGQAMAMVNRNLTDARLRQGQQHEQNQIQRAGMLTVAAGPPMAQGQGGNPYRPASVGPMNIPIKLGANDTVGQDANEGQPVSTNPQGGGRGQSTPSYRNPYA